MPAPASVYVLLSTLSEITDLGGAGCRDGKGRGTPLRNCGWVSRDRDGWQRGHGNDGLSGCRPTCPGCGCRISSRSTESYFLCATGSSEHVSVAVGVIGDHYLSCIAGGDGKSGGSPGGVAAGLAAIVTVGWLAAGVGEGMGEVGLGRRRSTAAAGSVDHQTISAIKMNEAEHNKVLASFASLMVLLPVIFQASALSISARFLLCKAAGISFSK